MTYRLRIMLIAFMILSLSVQAQKKTAPASVSTLTGLSLPAGTQQDKRGLSTAGAKMLFELESKKAGVEVKTPEVFILPPVSKGKYDSDSLVDGLEALGWSIQPISHDNTYAWLQKGDKYVMAYFEMGPRETSLYFAETNGVPTIAAPAAAVTPPATPVQTGNDTRPPVGTGNTSPGGQPGNPPPGTPVADKGNMPAAAGGYTYHTTNFDDGWNSTIGNDKVIVTKGALRVFIYFPEAYTDASRAVDGRDWAWDRIITRDFTPQTKQYRDHGQVMSVMQAPYVEGWAIERSSGKKYFLALYTGSATGQMFPTLAIAPDEASLRAAFPKAEEKYESDLEKMRGANRFAVDARDLPGDWVGGDGAALNYYDAYTGNYLGMNSVSITYSFTFSDNGTYSSLHQGASGQVGNMRAYREEYKGNYVVDRWSITMDKRYKGATDSFNCYFEAVRGGRVLHLQDKKAVAMWYHLVKKPS